MKVESGRGTTACAHCAWCLVVQSCGKHMIHPHNAEEAAAHRAECGARHARLQARLRSNEVECGICYEKVRWLQVRGRGWSSLAPPPSRRQTVLPLSQPPPPAQVLSHANPADRKFGLLACDHAFCLGCIRTWRSTGTADIDTVRPSASSVRRGDEQDERGRSPFLRATPPNASPLHINAGGAHVPPVPHHVLLHHALAGVAGRRRREAAHRGPVQDQALHH